MAENNSSRRTPPFSIEAEACVLGSMMLDPEVTGDIVQLLDGESFYRSANQAIYDVLVHLYDHNRPIDPVIVREELSRDGKLAEIGGAEYLAEVMQAVPSAARGVHYAQIVRDKAVARKLIDVADEILRDCYGEIAASKGKKDFGIGDELLDKAEHLIFDIAQKNASTDIAHIKDILKHTMEQIDRWSASDSHLTGLETGFADLDQLTSGLQPSNLAIVAGRPSMGKSSFAINIAEHVGLKLKKSVGIFTLEVSGKQIVQNLLCMHAKVNAQSIRNGTLGEKDYSKLSLAAGVLQDSCIVIDDSTFLTPLALRAKARRLKSQYDIQLMIVDYVQLMTVPRSESRQLEVAEISRSLKGLAKELDIPVLACAQLNRGAETRGTGGKPGRPRMSDLRESGALEQDADLVILLHRPEYYDKDDEELKGVAEIIVAKQRNGPTDTVKLHFNSGQMRFANLSSKESQYPFRSAGGVPDRSAGVGAPAGDVDGGIPF